MKLRFLRKWFVKYDSFGFVGGKSHRTRSFSLVLQYFNPEKEVWEDVPTVDDDASRKKAEQDMSVLLR